MKPFLPIALAALICSPALADSVTVTRPIRAGAVLQADDLAFGDLSAEDGFLDPRDLIGMEARVNLYPGRPIRTREIGQPTVIARNQIVDLLFERGGLTIRLEGRALSRAGDGDTVRVMNLASRSTVTGVATASGAVIVP